VLRLHDVGTDRMHFQRVPAETEAAHNVPVLDGRPVDPARHRDAVIAGFERMYRLLRRNRTEMLGEGSPLAAFGAAEVRVIVRPTRGYQNLLRESYHPDVLGNAVLRDALFDRLWAGAPFHPYLGELIPAERRALLEGDIPMFTCRAGGRDLETGGGEAIPEFFDRSGLDRVAGNLAHMSEADLALQLAAIRGSLQALGSSSDLVHRAPYGLLEPLRPASSDDLLAAALRVGERIADQAVRGRRDALWLALTPVGRSHWTYQPVGYELYNGLAGIALFLAQLGACTGDGRFVDLARAAWLPIEGQLRRHAAYLDRIGGFDGWGGYLYVAFHLAALWGEAERAAEAESWIERLPRWIERAETDDVLEGTAGCLVALLSCHRARPSPAALAAARLCGDRLLARARPQEAGCGWTFRANPVPLAGFSHGAAGIAWALLHLFGATGEDRFRKAALEGIAYERALYSPARENWPDLREDEAAGRRLEGEGHFFTAWCHGASGIGLARLDTLPVLDDAAVRAEIDAAVRTTLADGFGRNHCLCHGDLGNLELLLQAARHLGRPDLEARAYRLAAGVLGSIEKHGYLPGLPVGAELPGLMMGLAGIGYGLLRLARPDAVPAVLLLAG
jgi:type 2 lantibiotic biosynthesis protein LanM